MLTNSQCIEIAEKVWEWKSRIEKRGISKVIYRWWDVPDGFECLDNDLVKMVNSWQGFGRTVEAMDKKFFNLVPHDRWFAFYNGEKYVDLNMAPDMEHCKNIIEATHLSALEALK